MMPMRQQAYHPGSSVNTRQRSVCGSLLFPMLQNLSSGFLLKKQTNKKTVRTLTVIKVA